MHLKCQIPSTKFFLCNFLEVAFTASKDHIILNNFMIPYVMGEHIDLSGKIYAVKITKVFARYQKLHLLKGYVGFILLIDVIQSSEKCGKSFAGFRNFLRCPNF